MTVFIKNIGIILCCILFYIKLLHLRINKPFIILSSILTILLSFISMYNDYFFPYLIIPFVICSLSFFLYIQTKTPILVTITTTTISLALSYTSLVFSSIIIGCILLPIKHNEEYILSQIFCCVLQILLSLIPFQFKRTKKGMPFLYKRNYSTIGTIISMSILLIFTYINPIKYHNFNPIYVSLLIFLVFLAILIYIYWKSNLTKTYLDKLTERNLTDLNQTIAQQSEYITKLEEDNARLSKIVHKDNKLVRALENEVRNYLTSSETFVTDGNELLTRLNKIATERKNLLQPQAVRYQQLISTNVNSVNSLLAYLQQKAFEDNIILQTNIDCDMQYLTSHIINETDLNTLLADLIENARIATKHNSGQYILLCIRIVSDIYTISIFDSGISFSKEVLAKWGIEQITTHADESGSGIGMLTTYEIIKKYHASFIIHELGNNFQTYTKEITVTFNNRNQYILQTNRTEDDFAFLSKRADLQIIRQ